MREEHVLEKMRNKKKILGEVLLPIDGMRWRKLRRENFPSDKKILRSSLVAILAKLYVM